MHIAILGFGYQPPLQNLKFAEQAITLLSERNFGIAVGNVRGTFLTALETASLLGVQGIAVIDDTMSIEALPSSTRIEVVAKEEKHAQIAKLVSAGLVLGGAEGTRKLSTKLVEADHPVVAVKGTGGAVDDGSLPELIPVVESVEQAVEFLVAKLMGKQSPWTGTRQAAPVRGCYRNWWVVRQI